MIWAKIFFGLVKAFNFFTGFFHDKEMRREGAEAQAKQSEKKAEADEQLAASVAADVRSGNLSTKDRFTRPE
jgi:hypothetical protein